MAEDTSKREFIKTVGVLAAGAALGSAGGSSASRREATFPETSGELVIKASMGTVDRREGGKQPTKLPAIIIDLPTLFDGGLLNPEISIHLSRKEGDTLHPVLTGPFGPLDSQGEIVFESPRDILQTAPYQNSLNRYGDYLEVLGVDVPKGQLVIPIINEPLMEGERESQGVNIGGTPVVMKDFCITPRDRSELIDRDTVAFIEVKSSELVAVYKYDPSSRRGIVGHSLTRRGGIVIENFGEFVTSQSQ